MHVKPVALQCANIFHQCVWFGAILSHAKAQARLFYDSNSLEWTACNSQLRNDCSPAQTVYALRFVVYILSKHSLGCDGVYQMLVEDFELRTNVYQMLVELFHATMRGLSHILSKSVHIKETFISMRLNEYWYTRLTEWLTQVIQILVIRNCFITVFCCSSRCYWCALLSTCALVFRKKTRSFSL